MTRATAFLVVSRLEYLGAGIFFLFAVATLSARTFDRLIVQLPWVALGCLLWLCCHLLGSQVNCLSDCEVDTGPKAHLPVAVNAIGQRFLWGAIAAESLAALVIAVAFSVKQSSVVPAALFVVGWGLTMAYSLEPLRLKRRGFLSPLSLSLVLYGLPVALGYSTLTSGSEPGILALLVGVGVQMFGVITMNSFADMREDRLANIATPFVLYGPRLVASVALLAYVAGAIVAVWAAMPLLKSTAARLVLGTLALLVHGWVVSTIAPVLSVQSDTDDRVRRLGPLNALQFGVLGVMFGAQSLAVLLDG